MKYANSKNRRGSVARSLVISVVAVIAITAVIHPSKMLGHGFMLFANQFLTDTEYAPGYSEIHFSGILIGDDENQVLKKLGEPLNVSETTPYTSWLYTTGPVETFRENGDWPDSRYSFTAIRFDENGKFADAFGQVTDEVKSGLLSSSGTVSFGDGENCLSLSNAKIAELKKTGATPSQIRTQFGEPDAVFESRAIKWLRYSHSPGSTHYQLRMIAIDRDGKVCQKRNEFYWD